VFAVSRLRTAPAPAAIVEAVKLTRLTNTGKASLAAVSPDGKYVAHVVAESGSQSLWMRQTATTSNVQIVTPGAVRYDGVVFSPDGNYVYYSTYPQVGSFATLYQVPVLGGAPRRLIDDVDSAVTFSPDAKRIAFVRGVQRLGESWLMIANVDGTGEVALAKTKLPSAYPLVNPSWSPDGRKIALAMRGGTGENSAQVVEINAETGAQRAVGPRRWNDVGSVAWMADGRGLVFAADEGGAASSLQIWQLSYPDGQARRLTNDLNNYFEVSITADSRALIAVQGELSSHLFVGPTGDAGRTRPITSGTGRSDGAAGLAWTPDGKVVYASNAGGNFDIWISDADGGNARQLTTEPQTDTSPAVTADGRFVVFVSNRAQGTRIWRVDTDGGNPKALTRGPFDGRPMVSPDGKSVTYTAFASFPPSIERVSIDGGDATRLEFSVPTLTGLALSPDGASLAGYYSVPEVRGFRVVLFSIPPGSKPTVLNIANPTVAWTPDGRALTYVDDKDRTNLWNQPIAGGAPKPVTTFTSDRLFNFAWSRDGKQLALARGAVTNDVVMVSNLPPPPR
jgi:Tol biopolymer transport system component